MFQTIVYNPSNAKSVVTSEPWWIFWDESCFRLTWSVLVRALFRLARHRWKSSVKEKQIVQDVSSELHWSKLSLSTLCLQRRHPGREDLRHRRHSEQRRSGARQHGDVWPLHQHVDAPAVSALPSLQTRLRGHQEVHPERLTAPRTGPNTSWAMRDGSLELGQSVCRWPSEWRQHQSTPPQTFKQTLFRMYSCSATQPCQVTSSTVRVLVVVHPLIWQAQGPSNTHSQLVSSEVFFSVLLFPSLRERTTLRLFGTVRSLQVHVVCRFEWITFDSCRLEQAFTQQEETSRETGLSLSRLGLEEKRVFMREFSFFFCLCGLVLLTSCSTGRNTIKFRSDQI